MATTAQTQTKSAANYKIVKNITVINSRLIEPIVRSFGKQYSMLVSGDLANVGGSPAAGTEGAFWLNANAEYPNGDPTKPIDVLDKHSRPMTSELGEGSEISIAFEVVKAKNGNTYYNLNQIRVLKFVKPFSVFDLFDETDDAEVNNAF